MIGPERVSVVVGTLSGMDEEQIAEWIAPSRFGAADGAGDWRVLGEGACAYFRTGSFAAGARLVQRIGELPGLDGHHPDADLRGRA